MRLTTVPLFGEANLMKITLEGDDLLLCATMDGNKSGYSGGLSGILALLLCAIYGSKGRRKPLHVPFGHYDCEESTICNGLPIPRLLLRSALTM